MNKYSELFNLEKSIMTPIQEDLLIEHDINLWLKRDDLIHGLVSGNKWRKLKYNVDRAASLGKTGLLTFGGAYSNHLIATASACQGLGIESIGIVRGEELNSESNATLQHCNKLGMKLIFVSRQEYSNYKDREYLGAVSANHSQYLVIPEGGANYYGMIGCQEIAQEIPMEFDHIFVAQGTTTTSCGILLGLSNNQSLDVVPVLKGFESVVEMQALFNDTALESEYIEGLMKQVIIHPDYHFGGYAKHNDELLGFIQRFYSRHSIKLDPIYTGKAMYGLFDRIKNGELDGQNVIFVHTGGVQGAQSIIEKTGIDLYQS